MLNILIATKNKELVVNIINNVIANHSNARISQISYTAEQTILALTNKNINMIILDLKTLKKETISILNRITLLNEIKYIKSIVILSNDIDSIKIFLPNEFILDYILYNSIVDKSFHKLGQLINQKNDYKIRKLIINELRYLQYNIEYKGTLYLTDAIDYIYNNKHLKINNLQKEVYPLISKIYNKSINNIKCNIRRATDCMYNDCESKRLQTYFGVLDDEKPSIKEIIYTVIGKIG